MSDAFDDEELEDESPESVDPTVVPRSLTAQAEMPGFRGMNRRFAATGIASVVGLGAFSLWAVVHHAPQASASQPLALVMPDPAPAQSMNPVPDPTATPFMRTTPRPVVVASPVPSVTVEPASVPQQQYGGGGGGVGSVPDPSGNVSQPVATKAPEKTEAEQRAQLIAEAAHASSRMALAAPEDRRDVQQGDASAAAPSDTEAVPVADAAPHAAFVSQRTAAIGYGLPTSEYEVDQTTVIQARLMTAVDSTLPGFVKAQVTTPVYDSRTHNVLVIPPGAVLVGQYDSQTITGEARLLAIWTRILFPDGEKFEMGANEGAGMKGEAGLSAHVDTHAGRQFGNSFLYTLTDGLGNLISNGISGNRQILSINTATQSVAAPKQAAPTFHLYTGSPITVLVGRDLPLREYRGVR